MAAMVSSDSFTRFNVPQKIDSSLRGEKPSSKPLTMPVSSRLVPVAESQLKTNTAGSAVGLGTTGGTRRSEEHTSGLQSPCNLLCRLLLEKKKYPAIPAISGWPNQQNQNLVHKLEYATFRPKRTAIS